MKEKYGRSFLMLLIFTSFIFISNFFWFKIREMVFQTLKISSTLWAHFLIYTLFGCIFGIEHLFVQMKQNGKWKVNYIRLTILGVPSLLLGSYYIFGSLGLFKILQVHVDLFVSMWLILLGYAMSTSLYKDNN